MGYPNVFRPLGFHPYKQGGRTNPQTVERPVAASRSAVGAAASAILSVGDAYALDANGNAIHAGADAVVRGIVTGFRLQAVPSVMGGAGPVSQDQLVASDAGWVIGIEDPSAWFEVQADTFATTNIGGSFDLLDAADDTTLRQSRQSLNVGVGAGLQFKAIGIKNSPADNAVGANAVVIVRLLQSELA